MHFRVARFIAFVALLVQPATAWAQSETVEYYGLDAIGSVRIVFDPSGNVLARLDYEPFGRQVSSSTNAPDRKFAGLFRDGEAGLDHAGARSYQLRTGRLSSLDPIYAGVFEPQRWNRYTYALNNPLRFVDPTGLDAVEGCTTTDVPVNGGLQTVVNCPPPPPVAQLPFHGGGGVDMWTYDGFGTVYEPDWSFLNDPAAIVQAALDLPTLPTRILFDQLEDLDKQTAACGSGGVFGSPGACLSALAAIAPLPAAKLKAVNLPAWRKVGVDMVEVASGHMAGGSRVSPIKSLFPAWMSEAKVESVIRQAYRFSGVVERQGERFRVIGQSAGLTIEMWVNKAAKTIETAYPKW